MRDNKRHEIKSQCGRSFYHNSKRLRQLKSNRRFVRVSTLIADISNALLFQSSFKWQETKNEKWDEGKVFEIFIAAEYSITEYNSDIHPLNHERYTSEHNDNDRRW